MRDSALKPIREDGADEFHVVGEELMRDSALKRERRHNMEHDDDDVGEELMRDSALKPIFAFASTMVGLFVGEELMRDSALKLHEFSLRLQREGVGEELMRDSALKRSRRASAPRTRPSSEKSSCATAL